MDDEYRERIAKLVESHSAKEIAPKRVNKKPEEEVVVNHLNWFRDQGYFVNRLESKAKNINGVWRTSGVAVGTPDMVGCCPDGLFIAVEAKAPGRRSTLRPQQKEFLLKIIERGGYGICSDSLVYTTKLLKKLSSLPLLDQRQLLLSQIS